MLKIKNKIPYLNKKEITAKRSCILQNFYKAIKITN